MNDFAESLTHSDQMIITDIYAASEKPIEGITAQHLCQKVSALTSKPVCYLPKDEIIDHRGGETLVVDLKGRTKYRDS